MKQYKLKNKSTNEEVLCTKVVVDGFDYYVSDTPIKALTKLTFDDVPKNYVYNKSMGIRDLRYKHNEQKGDKNIIACNNPSIDIVQVIDECHISTIKSLTDFENKKPENYALNGSNFYEGFKSGYNTHSSTHTLSDDEVVEFGKLQQFNK